MKSLSLNALFGILCLVLLSAFSKAVFADEKKPSLEEASKILTEAALSAPPVTEKLDPKKADTRPIRKKRKVGIDLLRVGVPEGVTAGLEFTPVAPLTLGVCGGGTGLTITVCADATLNVLWKSNLTPIITMRFTNIRFTSMTDDLVSEYLAKNFDDQAETAIDVRMSGKWVHSVSGMVGLDWVSKGGFHLYGKAGLFKQVGSTTISSTDTGEVKLQGWWGPTAEIGLGGRFSWF